jgi:hypothetical protein
MRKRYVQIDGELIEVTRDYAEPKAPTVWGDLPDYTSPVDGRWVRGRVARREDLKRTGSRAWEGMDQERKVAQEKVRENDKQMDKLAEKSAWQSWYSLSPDKRRKLMYR